MNSHLRSTWCGLCLVLAAAPLFAEETRYQIVVYGGTSGGITAAIQAHKLGKSVVLIEPGKHLGGLTSGGLGATDIGNKAAIGGLSREFYQRIGQHYAKAESWKHESPEKFQSRRKSTGELEMWTFEPHVAEQVYIDGARLYDRNDPSRQPVSDFMLGQGIEGGVK